jgi:hypothetical protein
VLRPRPQSLRSLRHWAFAAFGAVKRVPSAAAASSVTHLFFVLDFMFVLLR